MLTLALALFATPPAAAEGYFAEVGPAVQMPTGGNWVRAFPDDEGWLLGLATGVGYGLLPLKSTGSGPSDWTVTEAERWWQVQQENLADHNLKRCPDGSWLHIATGQTSVGDDSAWWFRHDAQWNTIGTGAVDLDNTSLHHSDPSVMCSRVGEGVLFAPRASDAGMAVFFEVGSTGDAARGAEVSKEPVPTGGALITDVYTHEIHRLGVDGPAGNLIHVVYDEEWNELDRWMDNPLPGPELVYWPQGILQLGDHWLVGMLGNSDPNGGGNRARPFLVVYDRDWNAVEVLDLEVEGAGRPWLSRKGDLLLYTFDVSLKPTLVGIRLNLSAFGVSATDPDTGLNPDAFQGAPDSDDTGLPEDKAGCGCASAGGGGVMAILLGALGVLRRRSVGGDGR